MTEGLDVRLPGRPAAPDAPLDDQPAADRKRLLSELLDELSSHTARRRDAPHAALAGGAAEPRPPPRADRSSTGRRAGSRCAARRGARRGQASATGIVDRMEQRGLVERQRDDDDRRVVRVALDRRRPRDARRHRRRASRAPGPVLDELTDDELEGFLAAAGCARRASGSAREAIPETVATRRRPRTRRGTAMIALFRDYLPPYRWPIVARAAPAARPGDRQPVPARAQRRHHQRRRRQGRHRLHPADRRRSCSSSRSCSGSPRSSASTAARRSRWASGATSAARSSARSRRSARSRSTASAPPSLITRNTNDVQQVQMLVFMALTMIISAPILIVGGIIMALRQDVPAVGLLRRDPPDHGRAHRARHDPRDPAVPGDAGQARPDQPGHARDARRASASSARSSARATRRRASTRRAATCSTPRCGSTACSRSRSRADGDPQPVDRRGDVVRRHPRRQRRRCRSAT